MTTDIASGALNVAHIRVLNDALRTAHATGETYLTKPLLARGQSFVSAALAAVRRFGDFTDKNDPYGEHDGAFFDVQGTRLFFEIEYYDIAGEMLPPDPVDERVTRRVLTIGLAEDY